MRKVMLGCLLVMMAGCSSGTGWRVQFGVAPVTAIADTSTLTKTEISRR